MQIKVFNQEAQLEINWSYLHPGVFCGNYLAHRFLMYKKTQRDYCINGKIDEYLPIVE